MSVSFYLFILLSLHFSLHDARVSPLPSPIASASLPPQVAVPPKNFLSSDSVLSAATPSGLNNEGVKEEHHEMRKELLAVTIVVPCVVGVLILSSLCIFICRRRFPCKSASNQAKKSGNQNAGAGGLGPILKKFNSSKLNGKNVSVSVMDYAALESATGCFHNSNILDEGGSSRVYKARLEGNLAAAVKKLDNSVPDSQRELENEVDLLSRIKHTNLVSLLGYCVHGETRLLVYELMHNGTLESQLHWPSHGSSLTWYIRMKIALDAARGLECLHEHCCPPVIHRNLKSSNILLDSNFNAKLSDFGLAVTVGSQNKANIKLLGTLGYLAPEYVLDGKLTEKSDVYAFGVILLELLLGRKPVEKMAPSHCQSLVTWAMPQLTDRVKLPNIIDPIIKNTMDPKHLYQVAAVAVLCVQPEPSYRPLITDVLHSLIPLVPIELGGALRIPEQMIRTLDAKQ